VWKNRRNQWRINKMEQYVTDYIEKIRKAQEAFNKVLLEFSKEYPSLSVTMKIMDHNLSTSQDNHVEIKTVITQKLMG